MENTTQFTGDLLNEKRCIGDVDADLFTGAFFVDENNKLVLRNRLILLTDNAHLDDFIRQYPGYASIANANSLPAWADHNSMNAGAVFFARHSQQVMNMLGLLSLPYCYTAADGAMVLYLSDRMRNDVSRRLLETASFLWDVMAPDAFGREGRGFASILKTRLMHAAVRYYTLKSGKWDDSWGTPVNQEDMAGTNLSFSLIVVRGLRKFGFSVTYAEQQAFMHLWNVIGYLLGLDESLLPRTGKQAFDLEEAIRLRQFRASAHGVELTRSLTDYFKAVNTGEQFSNKEILQVMRYLLGNEVADMLALPDDELSANRIRLLKGASFINDLKPVDNARMIYTNMYRKFKMAKPVF